MDEQTFQYDFESSIGYWITITSHHYQRTLNDELAPYGITFRQFQVLAWLAHDGELAQTELARRMMVEPPTLVGILDRMQREGWIERRNCPRDRRRKHVTLRPAAAPVWSKVVRCLTQVRHQATKGMSCQEVATLRSLLAKVQSNLGRACEASSELTSEQIAEVAS